MVGFKRKQFTIKLVIQQYMFSWQECEVDNGMIKMGGDIYCLGCGGGPSMPTVWKHQRSYNNPVNEEDYFVLLGWVDA